MAGGVGRRAGRERWRVIGKARAAVAQRCDPRRGTVCARGMTGGRRNALSVSRSAFPGPNPSTARSANIWVKNLADGAMARRRAQAEQESLAHSVAQITARFASPCAEPAPHPPRIGSTLRLRAPGTASPRWPRARSSRATRVFLHRTTAHGSASLISAYGALPPSPAQFSASFPPALTGISTRENSGRLRCREIPQRARSSPATHRHRDPASSMGANRKPYSAWRRMLRRSGLRVLSTDR